MSAFVGGKDIRECLILGALSPLALCLLFPSKRTLASVLFGAILGRSNNVEIISKRTLTIHSVTFAFGHTMFKLWPYFSATLTTADANGSYACYVKLGLD